jgi:hypothetical protein
MLTNWLTNFERELSWNSVSRVRSFMSQHAPNFFRGPRLTNQLAVSAKKTSPRTAQKPSIRRIQGSVRGDGFGALFRGPTTVPTSAALVTQTLLASRSPRNPQPRCYWSARRCEESVDLGYAIKTGSTDDSARCVENLTLRRGAGRLRGHRGRELTATSTGKRSLESTADDEEDDGCWTEELVRVTYIHTCFIFSA